MSHIILLGVLRTDLMYLGSHETVEAAEDAGRQAVLQGRANTTFAVESPFLFFESTVRWANPDTGVSGDFTHSFAEGSDAPPALNPDAGEQPIPQSEAEAQAEGSGVEPTLPSIEAARSDPSPETESVPGDPVQQPEGQSGVTTNSPQSEHTEPEPSTSAEPDGKVDPNDSADNIRADLAKASKKK